ncbi:hypothetical protein LTR78_008652 [Recurvomyces mirabilis]|uniref:Uncharacterized protein n=1 Tax=Recurvomyces mirabilis TaxID=574656 RepID=A0AAE0TT20_9PEZI|nr:hypothetical protein LTR78_008652 [Recurvomyces mirabilis]
MERCSARDKHFWTLLGLCSNMLFLQGLLVPLAVTASALFAPDQLQQQSLQQRPLHQERMKLSPPLPRPHSNLNFSSPSPLILHSLSTLLQQYPQTFHPNSHTIAPCSISPNTNLYHARLDPHTPPSPEWFAFDPEMSYAIAGLAQTSRMLTYRTTRRVRCLYFDGTSASLAGAGSMDAQMLLLHNTSANVPVDPVFGQPPPYGGSGEGNGSYPLRPCPPGSENATDCSRWNPLKAEYDRAKGLCGFIKNHGLGGLGWGYEGIVRMNTGFEMIWCNFSSPSAKLISNIAVRAPLLADSDDARMETAAGHDLDYAMGDSELQIGGIDTRHQPTLAFLKSVPGTSPPSDRHRGPPGILTRHPFVLYSMYEWFHAASKRYGFAGVGSPGQGETRVRIDSAAIFTFYDPRLTHQEGVRVAEERSRFNLTREGFWDGAGFGGLGLGRTEEEERRVVLRGLERRRTGQRVLNVSVEDGVVMQEAVLEGIRRSLQAGKNGVSSGSEVDWVSTAREIVLEYGGPLLDLRTLLSTTPDERGEEYTAESLFKLTRSARDVLHGLWMPFYEYPPFSRENLTEAFHPSAPNPGAAFERCKTQYESDDSSTMTASENVTYTAISEVLTSICRTLLPPFLETEIVWLEYYNNYTASPSSPSDPHPHPQPHHMNPEDLRTIHTTLLQIFHTIQILMAYLGWSDQWTSCSPGCEIGQVCAIPMWPVMGVVVRDPGDEDEEGGDG